MGREDNDEGSTSIVPTLAANIVKRSDALVLRGIRDLQTSTEAPAEYRIGVQFEFGASQNRVAAATHYAKAAELGYIAAQS